MKTLNLMRLFAMFFVATGLVMFTGCSEDDDDDDPGCTETTWYRDADEDGKGDPNNSMDACEQPTGYVDNSDDDDDTDDGSGEQPTQTLAEILTATEDLSTLKTFVDLDEELKAITEGTTAHTVFLPNNAAFTKLLFTLGADDFAQIAPQIIAAVLRFHFVVGENLLASLDGPLTSLQTEEIAFKESVDEDPGATVVTTGGSDGEVLIVTADVRATNGVGHIVETILIPPTVFASIGANLAKLSQPLLLTASFTEIAALVAKADTEVPEGQLSIAAILASSDVSNTETKYTVFAPTNDVLAGAAAAAEITVEALIASVSSTPAATRGFLLNHITEGQILAADLPTDGAGTAITMLSGLVLTPVNVGVSESVPSGVVLAVDPSNADTYVPIFAADVFKAKVVLDPTKPTEQTTLPAATNGALHVSAPITASPGG